MQIDMLAAQVVEHLVLRGQTVATAESCTGGMLAQYITSVAGASRVFEYGIVCYANVIKERELGVRAQSLEEFGAVSEQVCRQMATGVKRKAKSNFGIGITGIAGPGGGTLQKPVGTVFICVTDGDKTFAERLSLTGDRESIRIATVEQVLKLILVSFL